MKKLRTNLIIFISLFCLLISQASFAVRVGAQINLFGESRNISLEVGDIAITPLMEPQAFLLLLKRVQASLRIGTSLEPLAGAPLPVSPEDLANFKALEFREYRSDLLVNIINLEGHPITPNLSTLFPQRTSAVIKTRLLGDLARAAFGRDYLKFFRRKTLSVFSLGTGSSYYTHSRTVEEFRNSPALGRILTKRKGAKSTNKRKYRNIEGEVTSTLARYASGLEYVNHFRIDGPGSGNYGQQKRFVYHNTFHSSAEGRLGGRGLYQNVKNLALFIRARMGLLNLSEVSLRATINPILQVQLYVINELSKAKSRKITRVNSLGWSRGAVALIMLSHELNKTADSPMYGTRQITPSQLSLNIAAVDPVPGPFLVGGKGPKRSFLQKATKILQFSATFTPYDEKITTLSPLVKNFLAFYPEHELSSEFIPVLPRPSTPSTRMKLLTFPGHHGTVAGSANKSRNPTQKGLSLNLFAIPTLIRSRIMEDMITWKSKFRRPFVTQTVLSSQQKLKLYNKVKLLQQTKVFERIASEKIGLAGRSATTALRLYTIPFVAVAGVMRKNQESFTREDMIRHMIDGSSLNWYMKSFPELYFHRAEIFVNSEHERLARITNRAAIKSTDIIEPTREERSRSAHFLFDENQVPFNYSGKEKRFFVINKTRHALELILSEGVPKLVAPSDRTSWKLKAGQEPLLLEAFPLVLGSRHRDAAFPQSFIVALQKQGKGNVLLVIKDRNESPSGYGLQLDQAQISPEQRAIITQAQLAASRKLADAREKTQQQKDAASGG